MCVCGGWRRSYSWRSDGEVRGEPRRGRCTWADGGGQRWEPNKVRHETMGQQGGGGGGTRWHHYGQRVDVLAVVRVVGAVAQCHDVRAEHSNYERGGMAKTNQSYGRLPDQNHYCFSQSF